MPSLSLIAPAPVVATDEEYEMVDRDVLLNEYDSPYVLRVRDMPSADRPREKLLKYGPGELALAELVAILLGVGTRREEVMTMARFVERTRSPRDREVGKRTARHQQALQNRQEGSVMNDSSNPDQDSYQVCSCVSHFPSGGFLS